MSGGVVVANPGYSPELRMSTIGLAREGMLACYAAPWASRGSPAPVLPGGLGRWAAAELARRAVPDTVPAGAVRRCASGLDALAVLALRAGVERTVAGRLQALRAGAFDRGAARLLRPSHSALVACYGAARDSLGRARELGLVSYLQFPIAHHRFARRLLREEAELQPAFADTLQFHTFPAALAARWDEEIEAADRVLVPSSLVARSFREAGVGMGKVVTVPLGVDAQAFGDRPAALRRAGFRVIFVGQITQRKGISYLFEAFRRAAIPGAELVLVGRVCGSDRAWRGRPGVRHVPPQRRHALPALYRAADVFVMPSLVEGFCMTVLEAMACGLPVVVSDHAAPGAVRDGVDGHVVRIRDADAIADRLVRLHERPAERAALGRNARARALEYSWERFGRRLAALIRGGVGA